MTDTSQGPSHTPGPVVQDVSDSKAPKPRGRRKWLAIALTVVLSGWAWLYSYRLQPRKFWVFVVLWLVDIIVPAVVYANTAFSFSSWQDFLPAAITYVAGAVFSFALWLWALVVTIRTPAEAFRSYPPAPRVSPAR